MNERERRDSVPGRLRFRPQLCHPRSLNNYTSNTRSDCKVPLLLTPAQANQTKQGLHCEPFAKMGYFPELGVFSLEMKQNSPKPMFAKSMMIVNSPCFPRTRPRIQKSTPFSLSGSRIGHFSVWGCLGGHLLFAEIKIVWTAQVNDFALIANYNNYFVGLAVHGGEVDITLSLKLKERLTSS